MALAKSHQAAIEAELDREMLAEIAASSEHTEQPQSATIESIAPLDDQLQPVESLRFERSRALINTVWHAILGGAITLEHRIVKMFNRLVEKGEHFRYQEKRKQAVEASAAVKLKTVEKIHNLEHSIEHGLDRGRSSTLHWIGVPNQKEFDQLNSKVEELTETGQVLQQQLQQQSETK